MLEYYVEVSCTFFQCSTLRKKYWLAYSRSFLNRETGDCRLKNAIQAQHSSFPVLCEPGFYFTDSQNGWIGTKEGSKFVILSVSKWNRTLLVRIKPAVSLYFLLGSLKVNREERRHKAIVCSGCSFLRAQKNWFIERRRRLKSRLASGRYLGTGVGEREAGEWWKGRWGRGEDWVAYIVSQTLSSAPWWRIP